MNDYEERVKKLQDQAMTKLLDDIAEAEAKTDPVQNERRLFIVKLIRARQIKKLSQGELASKLGVNQPYISSIESGRGNPSLNTLLKIAKALDANLVLD